MVFGDHGVVVLVPQWCVTGWQGSRHRAHCLPQGGKGVAHPASFRLRDEGPPLGVRQLSPEDGELLLSGTMLLGGIAICRRSVGTGTVQHQAGSQGRIDSNHPAAFVVLTGPIAEVAGVEHPADGPTMPTRGC